MESNANLIFYISLCWPHLSFSLPPLLLPLLLSTCFVISSFASYNARNNFGHMLVYKTKPDICEMTLLDNGGERLCGEHRTLLGSLLLLVKSEFLLLTVCPCVAGTITTPCVVVLREEGSWPSRSGSFYSMLKSLEAGELISCKWLKP